MQDQAAIIDTAHALADAARAAILPHFRTPLAAQNKLDHGFDPVTEADRAAERAMRAILAERRPDDAILGEEYGARPGTSGLTWILDPIDGTRGFISGTPTWGVLIGLADDSGPVYGLIDQPYTAERFEGGWGRSRLAGPQGETPLAVRDAGDLAQATLMTTFPEVGTPDDAAAFARVAARARLTRYGMDCYAYALLALGHVDLVIEAGLQPYDIAAPLAVVQAAGGIVTDWQGRSVADWAGGRVADAAGGRIIAAATPALHRAALDLLNG